MECHYLHRTTAEQSARIQGGAITHSSIVMAAEVVILTTLSLQGCWYACDTWGMHEVCSSALNAWQRSKAVVFCKAAVLLAK